MMDSIVLTIILVITIITMITQIVVVICLYANNIDNSSCSGQIHNGDVLLFSVCMSFMMYEASA